MSFPIYGCIPTENKLAQIHGHISGRDIYTAVKFGYGKNSISAAGCFWTSKHLHLTSQAKSKFILLILEISTIWALSHDFC